MPMTLESPVSEICLGEHVSDPLRPSVHCYTPTAATNAGITAFATAQLTIHCGYRDIRLGSLDIGISCWGDWISGNRDIGLGSLDIGKAGNIIVSKIRYTVVGE